MPVQSTNPTGGIFQNIVQLQGSQKDVEGVRAAMAQAVPVANAVYQAIQLLPEGSFKEWVSANPIEFWKKVIALIKGRTYTTGQYILGERYIDQVTGGAVGRSQVPDAAVPIAQRIFTILFGVRITTGEDLDALDFGTQAYYDRGEKDDISYEAVERAVFLKQHYFPISSYNNYQWDLRYFEAYPLVAPIPGVERDTLYSGDLPGGSVAVNGVIPVDASAFRQYIGANFDPATGNIITATGEVIEPGLSGSALSDLWDLAKSNPLISAVVVAGAGYLLMDENF